MTTASELRSGKTHRDENFPVASWIIHRRHRALILAFYNFVRTADDIADHATLEASEKLRYLDLLEAELLGAGRHPARGGQAAAGAGRARDAAAPCARCPDRVPDGRDKAALRELGRSDSLLPLFGDAGRPLHARRPWREHVDLGRFRRAVRRPADQQSSAGLRQGFSRPQPRLSAARCAGRGGRLRRATRRRSLAAAAAAMPAVAGGAHARRCSTRANRSAPKSGICGSGWKSR